MTTREQANLLADLARTIRPAWDTRAIVAAIGEVKHRDLAEIAWALIRVAQNPEFRAPTSLTFDGDHWPKTTPTVPRHPHYATTPRPQVTDNGRACIEAARNAAAEARTAWERKRDQGEEQP